MKIKPLRLSMIAAFADVLTVIVALSVIGAGVWYEFGTGYAMMIVGGLIYLDCLIPSKDGD